MTYFLAYLIGINVLSIFITCMDKLSAKSGRWRTPERTLLLFSALGGSVGMYITMRIIHHKTRHKKFMIGIPCIFILQICVAALVVYFKMNSL